MKRISKSKVTAFALGLVAVTMTSLTSASAATTVRDHRTTKPVVRDHRADKPDVRDHRDAGSGGVTVKDSPRKRKAANCLGDCDVKICIGAACF